MFLSSSSVNQNVKVLSFLIYSDQIPESYFISLFFSYIAQDAIEDEDGDYRGKDDREHRTISEHEKIRVTWNTERRSYLEGSAVKR